MKNLLPCPFCGSIVSDDWSACAEIRGSLYQSGYVDCKTCDYSLMLFDGCVDGELGNKAYSVLAEKWNRRFSVEKMPNMQK